MVADPSGGHHPLEVLRENGVHTAIDDFGKGFSSLTQLKRLPIDALKIDGSFVRGVVTDRDDAAIVQAIIGLAKNLDLYVVAEGLKRPSRCRSSPAWLRRGAGIPHFPPASCRGLAAQFLKRG